MKQLFSDAGQPTAQDYNPWKKENTHTQGEAHMCLLPEETF